MSAASLQPASWPPPPASRPPVGGLPRAGVVIGAAVGLLFVAAGLIAVILAGPRVLRSRSESMAPAIRSGQYVVISRYIGTIARGDVVAFLNPQEPTRTHLFRVIVLPGERFAIRGGVVHVNGKALDEPYVAPENRDTLDLGPYQMPGNAYWLMGDNRRDAMDSRYIGVINRELIWGRWVHW